MQINFFKWITVSFRIDSLGQSMIMINLMEEILGPEKKNMKPPDKTFKIFNQFNNK